MTSGCGLKTTFEEDIMKLNLDSTNLSEHSSPLLTVPVFTDKFGGAFELVNDSLALGRIAEEEGLKVNQFVLTTRKDRFGAYFSWDSVPKVVKPSGFRVLLARRSRRQYATFSRCKLHASSRRTKRRNTSFRY